MIHDRKVVALVPIKEHSERVPGKNFRIFCGEPLFHHILKTLDQVYAVDQIVIDTDSSRITSEAPRLSHKIRILRRPPELCGDQISTNQIFDYDLSQTDGEIYLQTHTTNPILKAGTISKALTKFISIEPDYDSLFSVNRHQSRFYTHTGAAINHDPDELIRTQDLNPLYEENSSLYIFTKESFGKNKRRIGSRPFLHVTPPIESIDIDDEFSFRIAELLSLYTQSPKADFQSADE